MMLLMPVIDNYRPNIKSQSKNAFDKNDNASIESDRPNIKRQFKKTLHKIDDASIDSLIL